MEKLMDYIILPTNPTNPKFKIRRTIIGTPYQSHIRGTKVENDQNLIGNLMGNQDSILTV